MNVSKWVIVGDVEQLPSIGHGNCLRDIMDYGKSTSENIICNNKSHNILCIDNTLKDIIPTVVLTQITRSDNDDIISKYQAIQNYDFDGFMESNKSFKHYDNIESIYDIIDNMDRNHIADTMILTPYSNSKYEYGAPQINEYINKKMGFENEFDVGCRIMCTKNISIKKKDKKYNGDTFYVERCDSDKTRYLSCDNSQKIIQTNETIDINDRVCIDIITDEIINDGINGKYYYAKKCMNDNRYIFNKELIVHPHEMIDFKSAWAMSINKSQSKEWPNVITLLPPDYGHYTKQLFNTAVTRAQQHITIVGSCKEIKKCFDTNCNRLITYIPYINKTHNTTPKNNTVTKKSENHIVSKKSENHIISKKSENHIISKKSENHIISKKSENHIISKKSVETIKPQVDFKFKLPLSNNTNNNTKYEALINNNAKNKNRPFKFADGIITNHEGQITKGYFSGKGTLTDKNKNVYVGDIVNNLKHGSGKIKYVSRAEYDGQFDNDKRHGQGIYVWSTGHIDKGSFRDGEFCD